MQRDKYTRKKKIIFSLMGIALGLLTALIVVEIGVRLFSPYGHVTPEILKKRSLQYEPSMFSRYSLPQREMTVRANNPSSSQERETVYYINEKGYRGPNFTVEKPEGVVRIMFYGGSSVFDLWNQEGWPHRVECMLRQSGFSNAEVINAGVPGNASFDQVGRLFSEGHVFTPDYVVLYNSWNDIKYFRSREPLLRNFKPYDDTSDPRINYQSFVDHFLSDRSRLYNALRRAYYRWKLNATVEGQLPAGGYSSEISESALNQYRLNIETFVDVARNIGAVPILMTEARLVAKNNSDSQRARINYDLVKLTHDALYMAFARTDEIIYEVARAKQVDVIDTAELMSGKDELFVDHVHLSAEGSEVVARTAAQHLARLLSKDDAMAKVASQLEPSGQKYSC
jgi:hypothetical protein